MAARPTVTFSSVARVGPDEQDYPSVAALSDGRFVIGYNYFPTIGTPMVRAKICKSNSLPKSAEFIANETTVDRQERASLTGLANGRFVIVYTDGSLSPDDPEGPAVRGRIVSNDGQAGAEFLIPTNIEAAQFEAQVVVLTNGNFRRRLDDLFLAERAPLTFGHRSSRPTARIGGEILVEAGLRGRAGPAHRRLASGRWIHHCLWQLRGCRIDRQGCHVQCSGTPRRLLDRT